MSKYVETLEQVAVAAQKLADKMAEYGRDEKSCSEASLAFWAKLLDIPIDSSVFIVCRHLTALRLALGQLDTAQMEEIKDRWTR